jgi:hypothetical protein
MDDTLEFFNSLSLDCLFPIDDTLPPSILDHPISSASDIISLSTTNPSVAAIVLKSQAVTTQKAMDRAVTSFFYFNTTNPITEDTVLSWLADRSKSYASTSLWTMYSLLKKYLLWHHKVDLGKAPLITAFLKTLNKTHKKKQAPAFKAEDIWKWLGRPITNENLWIKIACLFELYGTLRTSDTYPIEWKGLEELEDGVFVSIIRVKTDLAKVGERIWVPAIPNTNHDIVQLLIRYRNIVPLQEGRLFLNFQKGNIFSI